MSRLGKKPIEIPAGVTVQITGAAVKVTGPKGVLNMDVRPEIEAKVEGTSVITLPKGDTRRSFMFWGLTRALIASMVEGVSKGYEKKLELVGVGFRAKLNSPTFITLSLGFSHPVEIKAPEGITFDVVDNTNIFIRGYDKYVVGQVAANIRKLKKPEPYKGKGIKYAGEVVRRKAGKAGKAEKK